MSKVYKRYREVAYDLPKSYLSWDLFGAGLDNLGCGGKAVELPLRDPNPDEVLLRVDALGLCFSDTKLIWAGPGHPRITGRDLQNNPTVPGHEAALTVVKVGSDWKNKFSVGQRFIIQADIKIGGEQKAFGYVQRGAMAQYAYAGPWVLDGEGVCYLLPIKDSTGYAEAALVEPWACVEAAYRIPEHTAPVDGGRMLVVFADAGVKPDFTGVRPERLFILGGTADDVGIPGVTPECRSAVTPETVLAAAAAAGGFTDVILVGVPDPALIEACDMALDISGVLCFLSEREIPGKAAIDIGRAHYELTRYIGASGASVTRAYGQNTRTDLAAGGRAWMVGAAGPMGQMHVQRALELANPPKKVFCTDLSTERLEYMRTRLQPLADKNGVELVCINVGETEDPERHIDAATGGSGFDDIYVHAPVAALVEHAAGHLARQSILNVFAGVGIGTKARLTPEIFRTLHTRLIGSSGSSMEDIVNTLNKMEAGLLATRMSLAALGGIEATWMGIKGVKENRFPGKTVIFPQLHGIDLSGMDHFSALCPEAAAKLDTGNVWTSEAEKIFLEQKLDI